jgi:hypothetical protein
MLIPDVTLGTRGAVGIDLVVDLPEGSHHSGHWGGLLADPSIILAHTIAGIAWNLTHQPPCCRLRLQRRRSERRYWRKIPS